MAPGRSPEGPRRRRHAWPTAPLSRVTPDSGKRPWRRRDWRRRRFVSGRDQPCCPTDEWFAVQESPSRRPPPSAHAPERPFSTRRNGAVGQACGGVAGTSQSRTASRCLPHSTRPPHWWRVGLAAALSRGSGITRAREWPVLGCQGRGRKAQGRTALCRNLLAGRQLRLRQSIGICRELGRTCRIAAATMKNLPFDPLKDLQPVGLTAVGQTVIVTGSPVPMPTLASLVEHARSRTIFYGTAGVGTTSHLAAELLNDVAGIRMTAVHYGRNERHDRYGRGAGSTCTSVPSRR